MKKQAWKRFAAVFMSVCMVFGMTDFSTLTAEAKETVQEVEEQPVVTQDATQAKSGYQQDAVQEDAPEVEDATGDTATKIDLKYAQIEWKIDNFATYTGEQIKLGENIGEVEVTVTEDTSSGARKTLVKGTDYNLTWSNNINAGDGATITANGMGDYKGECHTTFTIRPKPLTDPSIAPPDVEAAIYTGSIVKPKVKVTDTARGTNLVDGSDYTLEYSAIGPSDGNTATIRGCGNYTGTINITYNIIDKIDISTLDEVHFKVTGTGGTPIADKSYTGSPITIPKSAVEVKYCPDGGTEDIIDPSNYDVDFRDNTEAGEAKIVIKIKEDCERYKGTNMRTVFIIKKPLNQLEIKLKKNSYAYTGGEIHPEFTVYDGKTQVDLPTDKYTISYDNATDAKTSIEENAPTIRIESKPDADVVYKGTLKKTFTITSRKIGEGSVVGSGMNIEVDDSLCAYTGAGQTPIVTVTCTDEGGIQFTENTHYTVSYRNNVERGEGTASVIIAAVPTNGNVTGSVTLPFTIRGKSIAKENDALENRFRVTLTSATGYTGGITGEGPALASTIETVYDGTAKEPTVKVEDISDGITPYELEKDVSYKISWEDNTDAGEAKIVIEGIGNYSGKIEVPFTIKPVELATLRTSKNLGIVVNSGESVIYKGSEWRPDVNVTYEVKDEQFYTMKKGTDYTISGYDNNINAGTASVYVEGKGNYSGTLTANFTIERKDIALVAIKIDTRAYTGTAIEIQGKTDWDESEIHVTDETINQKLVWNTDYVIEKHENNIRIGDDALCYIKGLGNYTGTTSQNFSIRKELSDATISAIAKNVTYTGELITPEINMQDSELPGTALKLGEDFDFEIKSSTLGNTSLLNADEYVLKLTARTGHKRYMGSRTVNMTINKKNLADDDIVMKASEKIPDQEYTGELVRPDSLVKIYYGEHLLQLTDFSVAYTDNKEVTGTRQGVKITITGNGGNYMNSKTFTNCFKIIPRNLLVESASDSLNYTKSSCVKGSAVDAEGNYTAEKTEDLKVKYEGSTSDNEIKGPEVVVTYVDYAAGGGTREEKTITLTSDQYTISYKNAKKIGDASARVVPKTLSDGTQQFAGYIDKPYVVFGQMSNVKVKDLSEDTGLVKEEYTYTGSAIEPTLQDVYYDYGTDAFKPYKLEAEEEFTYSYAKNVDANENEGTDKAEITLTATGPYFIGTKTVNFTILKKNISNEDAEHPDLAEDMIAEGFEDEAQFTGKEIEQNVTLKYNDVTLAPETDYEVSYAGNRTDVTLEGQEAPTMTITCKPDSLNFKGSVTKAFKIGPRDLGSDGSEVIPQSWDDEYPFEGPNVEIRQEEGNLRGMRYTNALVGMVDVPMEFGTEEDLKDPAKKDNIDYTISYENNKAITNKACVVVKGHNNFKGEFRIYYTIYGNLADKEHTIIKVPDAEYQAGPIEPEMQVSCWGYLLEKDVDYTLEDGKNNVDVGSKDDANPPTITVKAVAESAYRKSRTVKFNIIPKDLSKAKQFDDDSDIRVDQTENIYNGTMLDPNVKVYNHGNQMVEGRDYYIDKSKEKDLINAGDKKLAVITAVPNSNYIGTMKIYYVIAPRDITTGVVDVEGIEDKTYNGEEVTQSGYTVSYTNAQANMDKITLKINKDFTVGYSSNIMPGNAAMEITGVGNYTGTVSKTFMIIQRTLDEAEITVEEVYYTGTYVEPAVKVMYGKKKLVEGEDYEILGYSNNVNACQASDASAASVKIQGKGNYGGIKTQAFTILGKKISAESIVVEGDFPEVIFDGSEHTIEPVLKDSYTDTQGIPQNKTLSAGTDYEISYEHNIQAGTARAILTGIGNYSGTREVTFEIKAISMETDSVQITEISDVILRSERSTPELTVEYTNPVSGAKYTMIEGTDYKITVAGSARVGDAEFTITAIDGGSFSGSKTGTCRRIGDLKDAVIDQIPPQMYTGGPVTPEFKLRYDDVVLKLTDEYNVEYSNNTEMGMATITVTAAPGKDCYYTGTLTVEFAIATEIVDSMKVEGVSKAGYTYTGTEIRPTIRVYLNDKMLESGTEYDVTYENNLNVGTASLTIKGKGIYAGTKEIEYKIIPKNLTLLEIDDIEEQQYTGKAVTPDPVVRDGNKILTKDVDYKVSYVQNSNAGNAMALITGTGNYIGGQVIRFQIKFGVPASLKASGIKTTSMKLSWTMSGKVSGYEVIDGNNHVVKKNITGKSCTITGLKAGKTYKYKVRAYVLQEGRRTYGSCTGFLTVTTKPATPKIKAKASGSKTVTVSWNKISGASGYEVYRSTSKSSGYQKVKSITKGSTVSYKNTKLKSGKKYYYKVRAYKTLSGKKVYSSYSSVATVTAK